MTKHNTVTRKEWRAERLKLLEAEKDLTRRSDELAGLVHLSKSAKAIRELAD